MRAAHVGRFGSGWAWLIVTPEGKLEITSTPNQVTLCYGAIAVALTLSELQNPCCMGSSPGAVHYCNGRAGRARRGVTPQGRGRL